MFEMWRLKCKKNRAYDENHPKASVYLSYRS